MPRRRPLAEISANRTPNTQLSKDDKNRILGRALAGQSSDEIAAAERVPKSTVNTLLRRSITRGTTQNKPRSDNQRSTQTETIDECFNMLAYIRNGRM